MYKKLPVSNRHSIAAQLINALVALHEKIYTKNLPVSSEPSTDLVEGAIPNEDPGKKGICEQLGSSSFWKGLAEDIGVTAAALIVTKLLNMTPASKFPTSMTAAIIATLFENYISKASMSEGASAYVHNMGGALVTQGALSLGGLIKDDFDNWPNILYLAAGVQVLLNLGDALQSEIPNRRLYKTVCVFQDECNKVHQQMLTDPPLYLPPNKKDPIITPLMKTLRLWITWALRFIENPARMGILGRMELTGKSIAALESYDSTLGAFYKIGELNKIFETVLRKKVDLLKLLRDKLKDYEKLKTTCDNSGSEQTTITHEIELCDIQLEEGKTAEEQITEQKKIVDDIKNDIKEIKDSFLDTIFEKGMLYLNEDEKNNEKDKLSLLIWAKSVQLLSDIDLAQIKSTLNPITRYYWENNSGLDNSDLDNSDLDNIFDTLGMPTKITHGLVEGLEKKFQQITGAKLNPDSEETRTRRLSQFSTEIKDVNEECKYPFQTWLATESVITIFKFVALLTVLPVVIAEFNKYLEDALFGLRENAGRDNWSDQVAQARELDGVEPPKGEFHKMIFGDLSQLGVWLDQLGFYLPYLLQHMSEQSYLKTEPENPSARTLVNFWMRGNVALLFFSESLVQGFKTTYPFLSGQAGADCRDVTLEQENFYALCQKKEQIDGTVSNLLACAATNLLFLCLMAEIGQGVVESLLRPGRKDGYITTSQVEQGKVFEIPEALQWTLKKYILDAEKGAYKQPGDRSETVEKFTKVIQGAVETLSPKDPKLKSKVLKIQRPGLLPATRVKGLELAAAFVPILGGLIGGALFSTKKDLSPIVLGMSFGLIAVRPMQNMLGRCCTNQSESLSSEGYLDSTSRSNELGFREKQELAKELTKKVLFVRYSSLTKLQKTSIINQINIMKDFSDDSIHKVTENIDKDVKQLDKKLDGLDQDGKRILVYTKDTVDDLNAKIEV